MMKKNFVLSLIVLILFFFSASVFGKMVIRSKDGRTFNVPLRCDEVSSIEFADTAGMEVKDYKGNKIYLPCGNFAFADRVADFKIGQPAPVSSARNPREALGRNNYDEAKDTGYVTLGCGGSLTLEFANVFLVDRPGVDLHVFEVGPAVEPTRLEISTDGIHWVDIGRVSGGKASVDINAYVNPEDRFRFARLTDLKQGCGGDWPGADIDAIAAIGCIRVR